MFRWDGRILLVGLDRETELNQAQMRSIAFPAISTGIFGFPVDRCAQIMLAVAIEHLQGETSLERIIFCLFGDSAFTVFRKTFEELV